MTNSYYNQTNSVEDVRTILCLPALQKLHIGSVSDTRRFSVRNPPPHDGVIRNINPLSLTFDSTMLSGPGLDTILSTCPNAKELTMCLRAGLWNDHFQNQEACNVLRERGQNLEMVHFDSTPQDEFRRGDKGVGTFGSFATLNAKRLMVPKAFFDHLPDIPIQQKAAEAARLLPRGLRELYVLGVEDDEMVDVQMTLGRDAIPGLETLVCVPWHHFDLYEVCGNVHHRTVDYDRLGGFELSTRQ